MSNGMVMLDIETTGVNIKKDDILQIAMVEMVWNSDVALWTSGRQFDLKLHTNKRPKSLFAKKYMAPLYNECNRIHKRSAAMVNKRILSFFMECGMKPPMIHFCGNNAAGFDVPFLVEKKMLTPSSYKDINGKQELVGDFHYRVYDMQGAKMFAMDVLGKSRNRFDTDFKTRFPYHEVNHNALSDCYDQINYLNNMIRWIRCNDQMTAVVRLKPQDPREK